MYIHMFVNVFALCAHAFMRVSSEIINNMLCNITTVYDCRTCNTQHSAKMTECSVFVAVMQAKVE